MLGQAQGGPCTALLYLSGFAEVMIVIVLFFQGLEASSSR